RWYKQIVEAGLMIEFSFEERQFINRCLARARADQHRHCVEELRAQVARERDAMLAEMAALKAEVLTPFFELRDELVATRAELEKLRALNAQAQRERESTWRDRMYTAALCAQRDPTMPLH